MEVVAGAGPVEPNVGPAAGVEPKLMGADEAGVEPKRPDSLAGGGNDGAGAGTVLLLSKVLPNAIGTGAGTGAADEEVSF